MENNTSSLIVDLPFMKLKFVNNNLNEQLLHISSELQEAREAYFSESIERVAEEIADIAQSAITALHIIERQHGIHPIDVVTRVNNKNILRGYDI